MKFLKPIILKVLAFFIITSCSAIKPRIAEVSVTVSNQSNMDRKAETVEIKWEKLKKLKIVDPKNLIVKSVLLGTEIPSQVMYDEQGTPKLIIFQTDIKASSVQQFTIVIGTPSVYKNKVFGRQVPERFDDFAWENDRVAFRAYGEALESQKGMAKGIDFWAKRTTDMVINKWYKSGDYHKDNGEGVDAYHVGITLGAGNAAPILNDVILYPINYSGYKILANGPIRISFKLMYKPFKVSGEEVRETKIISLDAGSQMNKIIDRYETKADLTIAAGVTKHKGDGTSNMDKVNNFVAYWDPADGGGANGFMGVGVICDPSYIKVATETKEHLLMLLSLNKNKEIIYYQGGSWSKSGNFAVELQWFDYLKQFNQKLKSPLLINAQ